MSAIYGEDLIRSGVTRKTQDTNVLLVHSKLGEVKPRIFAKPPAEDFAFGVSKQRDAEGAREVSMKWVEHTPNPNSVPGPDFKAMNKLASSSEIVTSKEVHDFRKDNLFTLKTGDMAKLNQKPKLPSDKDADHVYGRQSSMRAVEETRYTGDAPDMKTLVQAGFMNDWVAMNESRAHVIAAKHEAVPIRITKAAAGHASALDKYTAKEASEPFKLSKFKKVQSKIGHVGNGM